MSTLQLLSADRHWDVCHADGRLLFRYQVEPGVPGNESPRPLVHPLYSLDGDPLTNLRPNDHPWHHGLSLTLTAVDGINFWGGPSYRAGEGYRWREDHGRQVHVAWERQEPAHLQHVVEWRDPRGSVLLRETRVLQTQLEKEGWSLTWRSDLANVSGRELTCDNYHSAGGLEGSHYTGLQFRGARALLDDHGDDTIAVVSEDGGKGEALVHGKFGHRVEWHTQHDTTLRRTRLRFAMVGRPACWFVRRSLPLLAFAPHREEPLRIAAGATLRLEHQLEFLRA